MTGRNLSTFLIGALVGAAVVSLVKTPSFRKGAARVVSAGMQIKNDAERFASQVKEDAEDIVAEAEYNNKKKAVKAADEKKAEKAEEEKKAE